MKTFYKEIYKSKNGFKIAIQRFNKGYKNLNTTWYKSGIRKFWNNAETTWCFCVGCFKLMFIQEKRQNG